MDAFIQNEPASLERAVERAASLLRESRHPLIAGLGTDAAGARAAIRLAARLGGVVDHAVSGVLLRDLRTLQDSGLMFTTEAEAANRADLLLGIGPRALGPDRTAFLRNARPDTIWLCPPAGEPSGNAVTIGAGEADAGMLVGLLRASAKGHRTSPTAYDAGIAAAAQRLRAARFGVAVFDPADHDELTIENVYGLVRELNERTRFSVLRHPVSENANGVNEVAGWLTGGPVRVGFGRGFPEHDPWRFDAARLVAEGEIDAVLWISTIDPAPPPWTRKLPTILVVGATPTTMSADVVIVVGAPGVDHDAAMFSPLAGNLAHVAASARSERATAADVVQKIEARVARSEERC